MAGLPSSVALMAVNMASQTWTSVSLLLLLPHLSLSLAARLRPFPQGVLSCLLRCVWLETPAQPAAHLQDGAPGLGLLTALPSALGLGPQTFAPGGVSETSKWGPLPHGHV